jgi:hypothetical protein
VVEHADEDEPVSDAAEVLLAALLRIPAAEAARIRDSTPSRRRPRRQDGPSADYGDE